jgi:RNA polymerase sigma factor (sigma-70 family)
MELLPIPNKSAAAIPQGKGPEKKWGKASTVKMARDVVSQSMRVPSARLQFPTTRWTGVLESLGTSNQGARCEILAALCRDYWYPLYAFARRIGSNAEDAEDVTQGFFAYVCERDIFSMADRKLGKLRTFLLTVFQRYIADIRDRERAQKRGGGAQMCQLNSEEGEELYARELVSDDTPEVLFDRAWAKTLIRAALSTLSEAEESAGRARQFQTLEPFLSPDTVSDTCYATLGLSLKLSEATVRQAVCRLRRKFKNCLRDQIALTLKDPDEARINDEIRALRTVLWR